MVWYQYTNNIIGINVPNIFKNKSNLLVFNFKCNRANLLVHDFNIYCVDVVRHFQYINL